MPYSPPISRPVPLAVKLIATAFVAVLFPVYWYEYGLLHFLWISDVALFATLVVLWRESRLLNSMIVLLALPFELVWMADFIWQLVMGSAFLDVAAYMFDAEMSLFLRGLSLFHLPLPPLWLWLLWKWGYDPRSFRPVIVVFVLLILATFGLTDPAENINWVFNPQVHEWEWISQPLWLLLYLVAVPLLWLWPLHLLLKKVIPVRT